MYITNCLCSFLPSLLWDISTPPYILPLPVKFIHTLIQCAHNFIWETKNRCKNIAPCSSLLGHLNLLHKEYCCINNMPAHYKYEWKCSASMNPHYKLQFNRSRYLINRVHFYLVCKTISYQTSRARQKL